MPFFLWSLSLFNNLDFINVGCVRAAFSASLKVLLGMTTTSKRGLDPSALTIDSHIRENISSKVINVKLKKYLTKNEALRNTSLDSIFLWRITSRNNSRPSSAVKWQNKTKYRTWNPRRLVFVKKIHISVFGYIKCYSSVSFFKTPSNPVEQEDFDSSNLTFQVFIF